MTAFETFLNALILQAGYNSALVALGAAFLGLAAGGVGTFIFLRKRALVSDAVAHASLPGVGLAFLVMVLLGGDGRFLPGLLLGSALSAWFGLVLVEWMGRKTRLSEDASIGAVLSVFFGFGIVLLTIIQNLSQGRQAGLESFLLGSTAGMLFDEALTIALAAGVCALLVFAMRRIMVLVAFDADYAATTGIDIRRTDLMMMGVALIVTVVGLKVVGLVLIVALLIIPPVTARFWTNQTDRLILLSALIGGVSAYLGACLSSAFDKVPTGPIIVLLAFGFFFFSLLFSPVRGLLASALGYSRFQRQVHLRQGLLALARGEAIYDQYTLLVLRQSGFIRADGVATEDGKGVAAKALRDEARWHLARMTHQDDSVLLRYDGLTPIEEVLTRDEILELDRQLGQPVAVE